MIDESIAYTTLCEKHVQLKRNHKAQVAQLNKEIKALRQKELDLIDRLAGKQKHIDNLQNELSQAGKLENRKKRLTELQNKYSSLLSIAHRAGLAGEPYYNVESE